MIKDFSLSKNKIFIDKHNRSMYYRHNTKTAYVIPPNEMNKFKLYYYRPLVALVAFVLSNNYFFEMPYAIGFSVLLYLYLEWYFQRKLMKNYAMIKKFDPTTIPVSIPTSHEEPIQKSIFRIALYVAFAVLLVVNAHIEQYGTAILLGSYAVAGFALYKVIQLLVELVKIKKK